MHHPQWRVLTGNNGCVLTTHNGCVLQRNAALSGMSNSTSQDGTTVTFNLPVDMTTVKAEYFEWAFQDGTKRKAACAIPGGRPAGEPNEQQTIALVGNAGGWSYLKATALTIVGDLMLIAKNGTRVSAKGLSYSGTEHATAPACCHLERTS